MKEIQSDTYSIYIGDKVLNEFNSILENFQDEYSKIFILCDENSSKYCLPHLIGLVPMLIGAEIIEIESGEQSKTLSICNDVWKTISESQADRKSIVVNLGGGVVCDMGGFIASLYKRGLRFFHIPTTFLSQVDASVGGKLGVDLDGNKNQIGLYRNPDLVIIDPIFLETLPKRHFISGWAEVFKHALIADDEYWNFLIQLNLENISDIESVLYQSILIKNKIVMEDWEEKGPRKILNFGHTVGHALESQSLQKDRDLLHGEAIAMGMVVETILSEFNGLICIDECQEILKELAEVFPLEKIDMFELSDLLKWMHQDKKNIDSQINFTLLSSIGQAKINARCSLDQIEEALNKYNLFLS